MTTEYSTTFDRTKRDDSHHMNITHSFL